MKSKCKRLSEDGRTCLDAENKEAKDNWCMYAINAIQRKPWCFVEINGRLNNGNG